MSKYLFLHGQRATLMVFTEKGIKYALTTSVSCAHEICPLIYKASCYLHNMALFILPSL